MANVQSFQSNALHCWNLKDNMHEHHSFSSANVLPLAENKTGTNFGFSKSNEAFLVLAIPPESRFRYRYDTEMSGTHGSLQGTRTGREKTVPTVQLHNYPYEALIRVTLVTCQSKDEYYPHPHSLFVKEKLYQKRVYENWDNKCLTKTGHYSSPHYIRVGTQKQNYTAKFEGMCIINSKKENFHSSVREKLQMRLKEQKYGTYKICQPLKVNDNDDIANITEEAVNSIDVDFVCLCFEAFREEGEKLIPICPPIYSEPIGNAKSAKTGKLKISRINKCSGSCNGGDEIWMLVEKINKKGLIVKFWEEYNGKTIWESSLEGDDLILHHQYAIIFKTPVYKDVNILSEVEVLMRLERITQPNQPCDYSEPITFIYEPLKNKFNKDDNLSRKESILTPLKPIHIKRPRTDSSSLQLYNYQEKFKSDDLEFENMSIEDSTENYIEQILFSDKDLTEFDQAWSKFNVEEFLQFISSDDVDMPFQKDGISFNARHRRDLLYKLYILYTKLDESDIKKLTEDVNNFRVSKKEIFVNKSAVEKEQVKDAASTLLSLRSRAMTNNNSCGNSNLTPKNLTINKICDAEQTNNVEKFDSILDSFNNSCQVEPSVPNSVLTSVIKNSLLKPKLLKKDDDDLPVGNVKAVNNENMQHERLFSEISKNTNDKIDLSKSSLQSSVVEEQIPNLVDYKLIKKEVLYKDYNKEKLDLICQILNENNSWKIVAKKWNCGNAIPEAEKSSNPAKFLLDHVEKLQGNLDLNFLRYILNSINERKALNILEEILARFA